MLSTQSHPCTGTPVTTSPELSALCEAVYKVPILQTSLPELETLPEIDMTDRKEKDNEIKAGQMFMKKELI